MATHTKYAGDDWTFTQDLVDTDGAAVTALDDAWLSIYEDQDTETAASYELSDAEMTFSTPTLTVVVPAATTTDIDDGTYFMDIKQSETGGEVQTAVSRDRVRCINTSPLFDDF